MPDYTDTSVKFFLFSHTGAPALANYNAGSLITILDACLVTGFGSVTLDSLVVANNEATATLSTGHGFAMHGLAGPVITIEGATPAGLNGEWRIASVPSSTQFTFATSGISNQTATGTITAKRAPAGWEKVFSGTNKAVYRPTDVTGPRPFLRVDDTVATSAGLAIFTPYEDMTDVDTGTGAKNPIYFLKPNTTKSPSFYWTILADSQAFYFFANLATVSYTSIYAYPGKGNVFFGNLASPTMPGDNFHSAIVGYITTNTSGSPVFSVLKSHVGYLARSYDQINSNRSLFLQSHAMNGTQISSVGADWVSEIGLLAAPVQAWENNAVFRGLLPGYYAQVHDNLSWWGWTIYEHIELGTLYCIGLDKTDPDMYVFFSLIGPWR